LLARALLAAAAIGLMGPISPIGSRAIGFNTHSKVETGKLLAGSA
jgi:hypothetical protein